MTPFEIILFKLLYAVIIGGIIGAEREYRSKSAGFRTMILICVGSLLFTIFSIHINPATPDRIASNILTGIGFLGAGVIFRSESRVTGITTAATIWITAALGIGIALADYLLVLAATLVVMCLQSVFTRVERWIDRINQSRNYKIVTAYHPDVLKQYEQLLLDCKLEFKRTQQARTDDEVTGTWLVHGSEKNHNVFIEKIFNDLSVKQFEF